MNIKIPGAETAHQIINTLENELVLMDIKMTKMINLIKRLRVKMHDKDEVIRALDRDHND